MDFFKKLFSKKGDEGGAAPAAPQAPQGGEETFTCEKCGEVKGVSKMKHAESHNVGEHAENAAKVCEFC